MSGDNFGGDKKAPMRSPLASIEKRFILRTVDKFPSWIEGYHLTMLTLPWSAGLIVFGYLAAGNIQWLWGSSAMLFLQWFTDSFDGALGRRRDTGIPKWGFYMDHFLDFVFMWCLPLGYVFIVSPPSAWMLVIVAFIYSLLMVNSFLAFGATNEFKITYLGLGPTEVRIGFIALNTALIVWGPRFLMAALPYALGVFALGLIVIVVRTQKYVWRIDMQDVQARDGDE